jgi:predicted transcriptional regulator
MILEEVRRILDCKVIVGNEKLETVVDTACASDLMSDVLAFGNPGALLLTGLTNSQSVQTADIMDAKAIVYVRGKNPSEEAVKLAKEKGIPLLSTNLLMYETCGKLYSSGLKSKNENIGKSSNGS